MRTKVKLVFIGRPVIAKGFLDLISALHYLMDYSWCLSLVGDFEPDQIYSNTINDRLVFLGTVPNIELNAILNDHDLVIVPSHYENFGHVALEAMASGKPVIASYTGGLKYLIEDQLTGLHFTPGNICDLSNTIRYAFENLDLVKSFGINGSEKAKKFSWDIIGPKTEELFLRFV